MRPWPAPRVDLTRAANLAREFFDIDVTGIRDLGSHQDRNFGIDAPTGRFVLKVANAGQSLGALAAQDAAMRHLPGVPLAVPAPIPPRVGSEPALIDIDGATHAVRLLAFVPGTPPHDLPVPQPGDHAGRRRCRRHHHPRTG